MSFYCGSSGHQHESVAEAKTCPEWQAVFGNVNAPAPPPTQPPAVQVSTASPTFGSKAFPNGPLSKPQYDYIVSDKLKGDGTRAMTLTYAQASDYIRELLSQLKDRTRRPSLSQRIAAPTATATQQPEPERELPPYQDPRLVIIDQLFEMIEPGYYAAPMHPESSDLTFVHFSKPTKGRYAGALKFQEVIGSGGWSSYRLEERAVRWSAGRWLCRDRWFIDVLIGIATDHQTAARRYSAEIGRCCRCNAVLTDDRSRYFGIGPECETYWPHIIAAVIDDKGPYRFGQGVTS